MSFGSALGEPLAVADAAPQYTEDTERIQAYGYRAIHRAPPDVGLTDLAANARGPLPPRCDRGRAGG